MEHIIMQKHLYWDKYCVRRFPYRGKRKYFPCLYQDYDGRFMIRNDVLGLTIAQFEREFKELLARRTRNEAQIQNARFPDKTSNEYIEYLKYGDNTVQGCSRAGESDEDRQVCKLAQVAGTEYDIRVRQRMFILLDNLKYKSYPPRFKFISSGSLAEGIDLPGSDLDQMFEMTEITVIDDIKHLRLSTRNTTLLMENDIRFPGFSKLKLVAEGYNRYGFVSNSFMETQDGVYLSNAKFLRMFLSLYKSRSLHGPCLSDADQYVDVAYCLRSKNWPNNAFDWYDRHRKSQWPSYTVIDSILKEGCLLVPIGPRNSVNEMLWRISFSMAEKRLIHSMNYTQLLCYVLLKLTLKKIINRNEQVKDLLCSYFLKTTVFWLSEEISINIFKISNLSHCFSLCINKLVSFVRNCYCPNYFIPQHNMFTGKIDESNSKPLLNILVGLGKTQLSEILDRIFDSHALLVSESPSTFVTTHELSVNLECLFYKIVLNFLCKNVETACTTLQYIESLMKSESSEFLLGFLQYYYAAVKQRIPQMLVLSVRRSQRFITIRRCHKHLMDGTKSDAVSGWLLYASFHFVLGQYKKTLDIVDNVLSHCTPDMTYLGKDFYSIEDINKYKQKTEKDLTLNHKMRQATLNGVRYIKQSTLIPQELHLEVQDQPLSVPPVVMSHCLRFLCFHHLGDVVNKQIALREFYLTIKMGYFVPGDLLSCSLVILGVCHEVSGDSDTALDFYHDALHCEKAVCRSAKQRFLDMFNKTPLVNKSTRKTKLSKCFNI